NSTADNVAQAGTASPGSLLALHFPSDPQVSPDGRQVAFVLTRTEEEDLRHADAARPKPRLRSQIWHSDGGQARPLTRGEGTDASPRWSPDGTTLAFTRAAPGATAPLSKPQLYLLPLSGGEGQRITEFEQGVQDIQWSPDGRFLTFLSAGDDEDQRDEWGEARIITRPRYRFNGRDWLPETPARLWRYELATDTLTEWHAPAVEMTAYAWWPNSSGVVFVSSTDERAASQWQQELFNLPLTGKVSLFGRWNSSISTLAPHAGGQRVAVVGRPEGKGSPEDDHLFVLHAGGTSARLDAGWDCPLGQLVGGDCHVGTFPVRPVWHGESLMVLSTVKGSCGLFRVEPDGTVTAHDHQPGGVISAFTGVEGGLALIRESATQFPEVELNGVAVTDLHARLPFAVRTPEQVTFATDAGEGEGWVLLPGGDARVPTLLSIHGGPHTAYGHAFVHEFQLLTARGYGVAYSNPRGSVGYGQAWSSGNYGRWGSVDYDDLMGFFDTALAAFPRLDGQNAAVMGGSYGGYMTNWITGHTGRFRAAITDRSICNLVSFSGTSDIGMRFWHDELGLSAHRSAEAEQLWAMSPLKFAEAVRTPTLIVHSVLDHRCPIEQAEQWYAALTQMGVPVRMVRFPGENHELSRSGRPDRRIHRLEEYLGWLDHYLGTGR
ncbi:MAG: peptidase, partial [Deinococcus sp.]|nr:peptidase [Deinococcus sp.]